MREGGDLFFPRNFLTIINNNKNNNTTISNRNATNELRAHFS